MAVFKCKMCGADLNIREDMKIAMCEYCGSTQTLPNIDNEKKLNLFNRANHLRRANDFDRAASIYESIIAEFPEEAESYWGLCLCNYGIEYVDDPLTGEKKPTCHRASFDSLQKDENFKLALDYADVSARKVYRDEAREIDRIMEEILSISKNEKPYDVFICYKEKDDSGERTPDSVLAQDIYDALTAKGLKVFFSRITLEDKLGTAYEPYIFAALNSAKVMLAVGTKYEYFNAVWVRNEWSRFLKLMNKDKSKVLIPCFKDIDPYDIPEEFSHLQAQDMSKIGFIQDLVHGVQKITGEAEIRQPAVIINDDSDRISAILERAKMFLDEGNFRKANDVFEQALNVDHKNAQVYLGKLLADTESKNIEDLTNSFTDFSENENYLMILRFGDAEIIEKVKECLEENKKNINARKNDSVYTDALKKLKKGDIDSVKAAAEAFNGIKDWKDSKEQLEVCRKKIEEIYNEKRNKKNIKITLFLCFAFVVVFFVFILVLYNKIIPKNNYDKAVALMAEGHYSEAISIFDDLDNRWDSAELLNVCRMAIEQIDNYKKAEELEKRGEIAAAAIAFGKLGTYKDSWTRSMALWDKVADRETLSVGASHTVALKSDGTVVAVGDNTYGQCNVSSWTDIIAVSAGGNFTVGLKRDGSVMITGVESKADRLSDSFIVDYVSNWNGIVAISVSFNCVVGIKTDGSVIRAVRERNDFGRCDSIVGFDNIVDIDTGDDYIIGLRIDGTVVADGESVFGATLVDDWQNITAISVGTIHTVGLKTDGDVVAIGGFEGNECSVSDWHDIVAVEAGGVHTVGLKSDGTVIAVGDNYQGACNVSYWRDIVAISTDGAVTVGLISDGTVVAVGDNDSGQCNVSEWTDIKLPF